MKIKFSNGSNFYSFTDEEAECALEFAKENAISFEAISNMMEDETREYVHFNLSPCTEGEFLSEYLRHSKTDLIIG